MNTESYNILKSLVMCHSTPGDEDQVFNLMESYWLEAGWQTQRLGSYAVLAACPKFDEKRPVMMVCAHADSPGFILQSKNADGTGNAVEIGYPHFEDKASPVDVLVRKTNGEFAETKLHQKDPETRTWRVEKYASMAKGDRICYRPVFQTRGDRIKATFLDNRIGCWALAELANSLHKTKYNVILAVSAQEEFTGFGANVLAANVPADLVFCLDATYADKAQKVKIGGGPVITLTDKSVLMSRELRGSINALAKKADIPLQEEVYNYSGTDAKSFPQTGSPAIIVPLLIATDGNHSPTETASVKDLDNLLKLLESVAKS